MIKLQYASTYPAHLERIGGQATHFKVKLWQGFTNMTLNDLQEVEYVKFLKKLTMDDINLIGHKNSKLFTIRKDSEDLIQPGVEIGFFDEAGNEFAPVIRCVSIQEIKIRWYSRFGDWRGDTLTFIDSIAVRGNVVEELARKDGFDSVEDFFTWYNEDFTGKIIHWTDLKLGYE